MRRVLGFVVALVGLLGAGLIVWRAPLITQPAAALAVGASPAAAATDDSPLAAPRSPLSDAEREARRLKRFDKDKNGAVDRAEFLGNRRKSFGRADKNGDGRLDFEEFAAATAIKFSRADRNADGALTPAEFAATALKRKPKAACECAPSEAE